MTAKVERLVNLVVALIETPRPLTLHEIRRRVAGYGQSDHETARRMFERDKDDLRRLGVPVETRQVGGLDPDIGYTIDRRAYRLPAVDLSVQEVTALAVALQVTGDTGARSAFTKLAARAPDPESAPAPPVQVEADTAALDRLADALAARRPVRFTYRAASGGTAERTVDGWGVAHRRGAWYLVGRDHARDDVRAFRLDRFVDDPVTAGPPESYVVPDGFDPVAFVRGPSVEGSEAEAAFAPAVAWEAARRGDVAGERDDGWVAVRFRDVDPDRWLGWVLGFGADAEVLGPPELRAAVVERLRGRAR